MSGLNPSAMRSTISYNAGAAFRHCRLHFVIAGSASSLPAPTGNLFPADSKRCPIRSGMTKTVIAGPASSLPAPTGNLLPADSKRCPIRSGMTEKGEMPDRGGLHLDLEIRRKVTIERKVSASAAGRASHIPLTPANRGSMRKQGIRNITPLQSENIVAGRAFSTLW